MRKIVKVLFLVVIAVLLGVVASVDVDAKVVEVVPQVPEQPAAVKDTCIKDCSRCEIDCIYEREDAMDSTADAVVGDEFEYVPGSDEFETVSNDEFEDVSGSDEFEQATFVEEVDAERGRLRVGVTMFGRSNPLDLDYTQVQLVPEEERGKVNLG